MLKHALIILTVLTASLCDEERKHKHVDPFAALDRHISHTLAYHYLWPWSQLVKAAAALDAEESFEEPNIISDANKFQVQLNVKRFKPDELRIKVKNRNIIVEGKQKRTEDKQFMANQFVQRFVLPPGSQQDEVTAVLNEKGILIVSVPRHEVPPPPPEREVPIEVRLPEKPSEKEPEKTEKDPEKTETDPEKTEKVEPTTTEKKLEPSVQTTSSPLEQLDLVEATTHVGKIRKKELKDVIKTPKDNEVTKGIEGNGLDYALIETEE